MGAFLFYVNTFKKAFLIDFCLNYCFINFRKIQNFKVLYMKKIFSLLVLVSFMSCGSKKKTVAPIPDGNSIVYVLPNNVDDALRQKINGNYNDIYFLLVNESGNYIIYYDYAIGNKRAGRLIKETKRKLLINEVLYPLIFDTDKSFGVKKIYKEIITAKRNNENMFFERVSIIKQ